jgi:hypothetical protein
MSEFTVGNETARLSKARRSAFRSFGRFEKLFSCVLDATSQNQFPRSVRSGSEFSSPQVLTVTSA